MAKYKNLFTKNKPYQLRIPVYYSLIKSLSVDMKFMPK